MRQLKRRGPRGLLASVGGSLVFGVVFVLADVHCGSGEVTWTCCGLNESSCVCQFLSPDTDCATVKGPNPCDLDEYSDYCDFLANTDDIKLVGQSVCAGDGGVGGFSGFGGGSGSSDCCVIKANLTSEKCVCDPSDCSHRPDAKPVASCHGRH